MFSDNGGSSNMVHSPLLLNFESREKVDYWFTCVFWFVLCEEIVKRLTPLVF
jgi:hypothetical protein